MTHNQTMFDVGTTRYGGAPTNSTDGAELVGRRCRVYDPTGDTNEDTVLLAVRVTKSGGLATNVPWVINASGEATDYGDGAGDIMVVLPDPKLYEKGITTVEQYDIAYVVVAGVTEMRVPAAGDGSGFTAGATLVTHDTGGLTTDGGVKSEATLSKATIGISLTTLAASTAGTLRVKVFPKY
jgi:hypothetical protein